MRSCTSKPRWAPRGRGRRYRDERPAHHRDRPPPRGRPGGRRRADPLGRLPRCARGRTRSAPTVVGADLDAAPDPVPPHDHHYLDARLQRQGQTRTGLGTSGTDLPAGHPARGGGRRHSGRGQGTPVGRLGCRCSLDVTLPRTSVAADVGCRGRRDVSDGAIHHEISSRPRQPRRSRTKSRARARPTSPNIRTSLSRAVRGYGRPVAATRASGGLVGS